MRRFRLLSVVLVAFVVAGSGVVFLRADDPTPNAPAGARELGDRLEESVSMERVMEHLEALARIAQENDGNRAAGTSGYDASADYVAEELEGAGYEVTRKEFLFNAFEEVTPTKLVRTLPRARTFTRNDDFKIMIFSAGGSVRAQVQVVGEEGSQGCSPVDFDGFRRGSIALLRRGECFFREQAANAERSGAAAVLIRPLRSQAGAGVLRGTLGEQNGIRIPVIATTFELGRSLHRDSARGVVVLEIEADVAVSERSTENIFAETDGPAPDKVMVGGHLDSVTDGPGINDNGSGVAAILEVARALATERSADRFRFAFWGAEEYGLIGSFDYVSSLSESEREEISGYLNFDMIASPNFVRTVYGSESEPEGSGGIETLFRSYFEQRGIEIGTVALQGRSDHAPFARVGIPVGGLFTGADGVKTTGEEAAHGGTAGIAHDPCYHLECDGIDNVDAVVLDDMLRAIAHTVGVLAETGVGDLPE